MGGNQEEIDKNIYDIICDVWEAYRSSSKKGDLTEFNAVFNKLHNTYPDDEYTRFISWFGMALAPFANQAVVNRSRDK